MKKLVVFTALIAMLVSFATVSVAENTIENIFDIHEEVENPWNVRIQGNWVVPKVKEFKNGWNIQGMISYDIWKFLAVGVESGYTRLQVKDSGIDYGYFNCIPILGDIIIKAPLDFNEVLVVPYIVNGFGGQINDFDESDTVSDLGINIDSDSGFAYKLGGGVDFYINDVIAINGEVSYMWTESKIKVTGNNATITGNEKLDALYLGGGITVKF